MSAEDIEASKAPLMDHLIELRSRLIKALLGFGVAFIFCFFFAKQIYNVLVWPFVWVAGAENSKFIYTALLEYFITQLKLALFGAGFISFPIVATQIYKFVAPGSTSTSAAPSCVSDRDAALLRDGIDAGLLRGAADAGAVFRSACSSWAAPRPRKSSCCEGRRISVADDVADFRLRHRVPAAGDPDAVGPHRIITRNSCATSAAISSWSPSSLRPS